MKKEYMKPSIEVETYVLSESIAANCGVIVTLGPDEPALGKDACSTFKDSWGEWALSAVADLLGNSDGKSFYNDPGSTCDCYYTSGGESYITS